MLVSVGPGVVVAADVMAGVTIDGIFDSLTVIIEGIDIAGRMLVEGLAVTRDEGDRLG